ncbi:MAG: enoyl-CoA hydratase/isomerase family protein [Candidatus Tectomicrobia bacterium]|uniref:Enoyl-CoA hydratase/isomerase family protein n=1 Tax=Tectimicrobiota bacterium TaxID=2528274 RepID=A0A933GKD2_UNCTE|nr:enoyl-CoA hydratase/isomerase family protein [Candidatus Tectomicrobia bacterium]
MPEFTVIDYQKRNNIAKITLARPDKRNAINPDLSQELNMALLQAKEDTEVKAVVVTGAGSAFCSGIDLAFFRGVKPVEFRSFIERLYAQMTDIQRNLGKPTLASLNGPTLAAGCSIAFSCDMIIASDRTIIGYPEINVGLMPAMHLVLLPSLVGRYKAFELCLTGEPITAAEALKLGMINKVVPHSQLEAETEAMAEKLASKSPLIAKYCKDAFYHGMDMDFKKAIMDAASMLAIAVSSEDSYEGLSAFVEKRKPRWKGL